MREILFRGKRVDNGEWVYGDLVTISYRSLISNKEDKTVNPRRITSESMDIRLLIVVPETVGQYTGLKDKYGVKIFEGDILKDRLDVIFHEYTSQFTTKISFLWSVIDRSEVIGNIHDNPELLND